MEDMNDRQKQVANIIGSYCQGLHYWEFSEDDLAEMTKRIVELIETDVIFDLAQAAY